MGSLATVHKEILIAPERANASFEKGDLRVEIIDERAAGVFPIP